MTPETVARARLSRREVRQFVKSLIKAGCPPEKAQLVAEGLARYISEIIEVELAALPI
jgi:hypothetical protein